MLGASCCDDRRADFGSCVHHCLKFYGHKNVLDADNWPDPIDDYTSTDIPVRPIIYSKLSTPCVKTRERQGA
jgi:hypothetical protein